MVEQPAGRSEALQPAMLDILAAPTRPLRLEAMARLARLVSGAEAASLHFLDGSGQLHSGLTGTDPGLGRPDMAVTPPGPVTELARRSLARTDPPLAGPEWACAADRAIRLLPLRHGEALALLALVPPDGEIAAPGEPGAAWPSAEVETGLTALLAGPATREVQLVRHEQKSRQADRRFQRLDGQLRLLDRERQKFLAVVNRTDADVCVVDRDGIIRWTNRNLAAREGDDDGNSAWIGRHCTEYCRHLTGAPCGDAPDSCPVTLALARNEAVHQEIHQVRGADHRELYLSALPILGPDGRPEEAVVLVQDLSDLQIVRKLEARYRTLFERSPNAILMVDPATRAITLVNGTVTQLFGHPPEALLRMTLDQLHPPAEWSRLESVYRNLMDGVLAPPFEAVAWTRNSGERVVETSVSRIEVDSRDLAVVEFRDLTERRRAEQALQAAEDRLHSVVANAPLVLFSIDRDGLFTVSEGRGLERLGLRPGEVVGRSVYEVYAGYPAIQDAIRQAMTGQELKLVLDVDALSFETWLTPIRNGLGDVEGVLGVATDVSHSKRLEEQLRHSQKMEAIGRLAGGVAHDFNNLLTVILGHCELMVRRSAPGDPIHREAEAVLKAGRRGADLARQLLAFSRKQLVEPTVFDLNRTLSDLDGMLRRLIGEDIDLTSVVSSSPARIKADPGQVEQIIMNLVVNSRDAMESGGKITLEIDPVDMEEAWLRDHPGLSAGPYVRLAVSDNGRGMDAETRQRIFEPFFTTKEAGKGTGLGLSIVYGIVRQLGGDIQVYSEAGQGTTFKVYLPRVADDQAMLAAPPGLRGEAGSETILLTEDEEEVRSLAREILEMNGYRVLEAACGREAIEIAERHAGTIHLLLTDVVMPGMSGGELAGRLTAMRPDLKVVYMSGYPDDAIVRHGVLDAEQAFVQKPFSIDDLSARIRERLGAPIKRPA